MSLHDWTRVEAGIFHDFHTSWTAAIRTALNGGLLPEGFYALVEQHTGFGVADVLTLQTEPRSLGEPSSRDRGGAAVAEAPPRVSRRERLQGSLIARRRTVAIRHVTGHRLVALVEIVSPANKDRGATVDSFAAKVVQALDLGVHVMVIDLLPPGTHDPHGMHEVIRQRLDGSDAEYELPTDKPLTLASYASGPDIEIYLEHVTTGDPLPPMPLFLHSDRYVNAPLEATYQEAYAGMPGFWRNVLEGR